MGGALDLSLFDKPTQHPLTNDVRAIIMHKYRGTARNLQVEIGPSEVGEPCLRKLAYKAMHEPPAESEVGDPLPSVVGTAAHTWMEAACAEWNEHIGRTRYIAEAKFNITPGMPGHCDCLDTDTWTVMDWKFPGTSKMSEYKSKGPSPLYRAQAHLYGKGWVDLGAPIKDVAIVFLPRGGFLSGMYIWSEPYELARAEAALERYYDVTNLAVALDVEHYPQNYKLIPTVRGHDCTYCEWFKPGEDKGTSCPGWTAK